MTYIVGEVSSPFGAHGRGAHDVRSFLGASDFTEADVAAALELVSPTVPGAPVLTKAQVRAKALASLTAKAQANAAADKAAGLAPGTTFARTVAGKAGAAGGGAPPSSNTTLIVGGLALAGALLFLSKRGGK